MIHHLSIAARDPKRVAGVLAEFMGGTAKQPAPERFPDVWAAYQYDQDGTLIEVVPAGVELLPQSAGGPRLGEARQYGPFHFAMSTEKSPDAVTAIAKREGWECYLQTETPFRIIDIWIENDTLIQLLPPAFAAEYRAALQPA